MHSLTFTVPGEPVPKARARTTRGGTYTPLRTRVAQATVAWHARKAYRLTPMKGRVALDLVFATTSRRRCDIDNLAKLVMDALNGIVWEDDAQIDRLMADRRHVTIGPNTTITITPLLAAEKRSA